VFVSPTNDYAITYCFMFTQEYKTNKTKRRLKHGTFIDNI